MEIRRVDPDDSAALKAYFAICDACDRFENPYPTPLNPADWEEEFRNRDSSEHTEGYLGLVDGVPVATGLIQLFMVDNLDKAFVHVNVLPAHRERGHGSTIFEQVLTRVREGGRTTVLADADYPFDADETHPTRRFLAKQGFTLSEPAVHRVLELPADEALLDRLAADSAAHHTDYTLVDWVGLPPEELRADYCVLLNHIFTDAPSGDVTFEEGRVTPEILVEREQVSRAKRRTQYITAALDTTGVPVAHNVLSVPSRDPGQIFNFDTLVRRDHRGHRLGLATKIQNLRRVTALHPERTVVHTWNAESNGPMIAVNDAMGFRPAMYGGEYVQTIPGAAGA